MFMAYKKMYKCSVARVDENIGSARSMRDNVSLLEELDF